MNATLNVSDLSVTDRARIMRDLEAQRVKDKSYQACPIGREVRTYLSEFRWAGHAHNSHEAYESVLAAFAKDFADLGLAEFSGAGGTERIMWWLDLRWGESSRNTKGRNTAIIRSFFRWADDKGLVDHDPAAKIRGPRARTRDRRAYDQSTLHRLVVAQPSRRDQCALQLLCRMGLRKNELRILKVGDIDLVRDLITVHGKGDKIAVLPIGAFATLRDDLTLHVLEDERGPDEYLLYARGRRHRPMDQASVHRWFKRCLENARLPETIKIHELRHSAADNLWRVTGNIVLAQQLLRHESVGTTQAYLHPTREDLSAGMRLVEDAWVGRPT
jgi:integrase/recombinase XerC